MQDLLLLDMTKYTQLEMSDILIYEAGGVPSQLLLAAHRITPYISHQHYAADTSCPNTMQVSRRIVERVYNIINVQRGALLHRLYYLMPSPMYRK